MGAPPSAWAGNAGGGFVVKAEENSKVSGRPGAEPLAGLGGAQCTISTTAAVPPADRGRMKKFFDQIKPFQTLVHLTL